MDSRRSGSPNSRPSWSATGSESEYGQGGYYNLGNRALPVEQKEILRAYEEFNDIPEGCAVAVYSLNEIATEKVIALGHRARNEPRDLYDLWFLTAHAGVELQPLLPAIEEKLRFRNKEITDLQDRLVAKEARLKLLWNSRLGHQMETLSEFDTAFRGVRRELRQAGMP